MRFHKREDKILEQVKEAKVAIPAILQMLGTQSLEPSGTFQKILGSPQILLEPSSIFVVGGNLSRSFQLIAVGGSCSTSFLCWRKPLEKLLAGSGQWKSLEKLPMFAEAPREASQTSVYIGVEAEEFCSLDNASLGALAHLSFCCPCTHLVNPSSCQFLSSSSCQFPDLLVICFCFLTTSLIDV